MYACLTKFNLQSPASLYSSLVTLTHDFFTCYVSRPHIKRFCGSTTWTIDDRIFLAERTAVEEGRRFQLDPTPDNLCRYQSSRDTLVALQGSVRTESWHKFTDHINQGTSVGTMWWLINRVVQRKPASALHHSPGEFAQELFDAWAIQSTVDSLPVHIQEALSAQAGRRTLRLMAALLEVDNEDGVPITPEELRRALARGKATSPGDDGITYSVLRLLLKVPGNPLLQLYNLCLSEGYVPPAWTSSTIFPIPKPGTDKFRPVSLTSCVCKVMECILLIRLEAELSPCLLGFMTRQGYAPLPC
ncbi:RNA-directed DNA polymerase from mobile element jockey [Portunus trituberculatus]|uniref:RNA-directed DNA polymerase from mobile element jockey n=1 Tax=Portunus trituberculatus TaxID=210409 RepID=A0A5B7J5W0_PORTR|nr:RNA-directed DNA polymerase from mobile element jockey [Portunus trituberculatus]